MQPASGGASSSDPRAAIAAVGLLVVLALGVNCFWGHWIDVGDLLRGSAPATDAPVQPPRQPPRGAKAIVEKATAIASQFGTYVCSDYREKSRTKSGRVSDHAYNNEYRAARDISVPNIDCHTGPPSRALDRAAVAIGQYFGRSYKLGKVIDSDKFKWHGYRIEIIWRTPKYGDHRGHIHVGACRGCRL